MKNKYTAIDNYNNVIFVNNLFYKKFLNDNNCSTVKYFNDKKELILFAEKLANGEIIKYEV